MYAIAKTKRGPGAEIIETDIPKIKDNEILVKVKVASICGSDVHIYEWNEWAASRIKKIPLIFGHEFAGEVVEVGKNVTNVVEGDFISAETHIVDNVCYQCRTGRKHVCLNTKIIGVDIDGAFAEYVAIPAENAWINDKDLEPELASIQEPLGNAVHTVLPADNIEDIAGKTVGVFGCGPIGLMSIAVVKTLGAAMVIATEKGNKTRIELAKKMGADYVFDVDETPNVVKEILDITNGQGVDIAFEMSGAASALKEAFQVLTPGGRLSILGLQSHNVEIDINNWIVFKGIKIYGIVGRRMYETWYQVKGLLKIKEFREKLKHIITHKFSMKEFDKGMQVIIEKKAAKVVLEPKW